MEVVNMGRVAVWSCFNLEERLKCLDLKTETNNC